MFNEFDRVRESRRRGGRHWHRVVPALGVLLVLGSIGKAVHTFDATGILLESILDLFLIGSLGLAVLYIGRWLPRTSVRPAFYPRILAWVVGGVAAMTVVIGLRVLHPGVTVDFTFGTHAVLLVVGFMAGLGIGIYETQARARAAMLAEQNEALQRTEERLEETVAQLEASTEQLEASNDRLEQFAYAASHDLREPLRMVTRYLHLVEDRYGDELDADGEEFIAYAVDGAERMDATIDGLLEFSRVETQGDQFEPVDLDDVLDDVLADLQLTFDEADAELTREPLPTVEGDESQLRQVFQNLLTNAVRYSGDEPPRIHVTAEREGSEWTISVRDDGPGIDPDDADRIFDIFQRLHTTDEQEGSGIGLALCERIVDRHDGEIRVDSEPGEGATFFFTLPPAQVATAGE